MKNILHGFASGLLVTGAWQAAHAAALCAGLLLAAVWHRFYGGGRT